MDVLFDSGAEETLNILWQTLSYCLYLPLSFLFADIIACQDVGSSENTDCKYIILKDKIGKTEWLYDNYISVCPGSVLSL